MTDLEQLRETTRAAVTPELLNTLTSQIDVGSAESILRFGADCQRELAGMSDAVLHLAPAEPILPILQELTETMTALDAIGEKKGLSRLFNKTDSIEALECAAERVGQMYVALRVRESELRRVNEGLERVLLAAAESYRQLAVYEMAAEDGCRQIEEYLAGLTDPNAREPIERALELLRRRAFDLRTAEVTALQTVPMFQMTLRANRMLDEKIAQALKVSIPVFRETFAEELRRRRSKLDAEDMRRSRERLNETRDALRASLNETAEAAREARKHTV